jgi:hypothetical protein
LTKIAAWLEEAGSFVAVVEHPVLTSQNPKTGWLDDHVAWPVNHYFDEGMREEHWYVDGVVKYHRTVSTLVNSVVDTGLIIDRIAEPRPGNDVLADYPDFADELVRPSLLSITASKPSARRRLA